MTLTEKLLIDFKELSEAQKNKVINFVEFLKIQNKKNIENLVNEVIMENEEALKKLAKY